MVWWRERIPYVRVMLRELGLAGCEHFANRKKRLVASGGLGLIPFDFVIQVDVVYIYKCRAGKIN
jgi:hypothetical protein